MAKHEPPTASETAPRPPERRRQSREPDTKWRTAITAIEPNKILVRGYPVDELMGRLSFGEAIYLLLMGELPGPALGRMLGAILVSSIDHGATPPSTLAARHVVSSGAPVGDAVAAGILSFGPYHGGDIEACIRFLDSGLEEVRPGASYQDAAARLVARCRERGERPPGFGHRFHTRDPRAARLFQMALELELEGSHIQMIRAIEHALEADAPPGEQPLPVNVDGAIAAVCADLGFDAEIAGALFIISRVPGLIAHAHEERLRYPPMRPIDPSQPVYDGPTERRLPETRK